MSRHDARLVPAAALAWAATWCAVARPVPVVATAARGTLAVALLCLVAALLLRGRSEAARGVLLAVALACAVAAALLGVTAGQAADRRPAAAVQAAETGRPVQVELVVTGDPTAPRADGPLWQREQHRVRARIETITSQGTSSAVAVPVLVSGGAEWERVGWGSRWSTAAVLAPAAAGASVEAFLAARGPLVAVADPAWPWRWAEQVRGGLRLASLGDASDTSEVPDGAALLPGLVVGDTAAVSADLEADMRLSGLAHLTAVSGANITLVCGSVLLLCGLVRIGRRASAVAAAVALLALVVVAPPEPSVLRAAVMGAVGLVGIVLGRRGGGLSALALAVPVVLLADPWLSRAPGFRLSVCATAGLTLLAGPWARSLGRVLPRAAAYALAVPAAAQAAVTPLVVGLDPVVSTYALPANMLAAPAVAPATVLGLLAALLSLLHAVPAAWVALPATWCAGWITAVARTAAEAPAAGVPWPEGVRGAVAAVAAVLLVVGAAAMAAGPAGSRSGLGPLGPTGRNERTGAPRPGNSPPRPRNCVAQPETDSARQGRPAGAASRPGAGHDARGRSHRAGAGPPAGRLVAPGRMGGRGLRRGAGRAAAGALRPVLRRGRRRRA